uniref:Uncharacterized protein n=1 Tax=Triticum urartu TaxID=4572 RepID=A0A8R7R130_TRIUA
MEFHQRWRSTSRFRHPPLEIIVILNGPLWSCTQILLNWLEFCIKEVSTSNSNPGVDDDIRVICWDFMS